MVKPENTSKPTMAFPEGTFGEAAEHILGKTRVGTRRRAGVGGMVSGHPSSTSPKLGSS